MTYTEQTAVRIIRSLVDEGASLYVPPVKRDVLRALLDGYTAQERELALLRQLTAHQRTATAAAHAALPTD